ncbi:DsbA family protein [Aurantimonas sp. E1-2-R+4]|uniref:2-hydroxychromene-2-carboxylate isomerase n=1 Tax=Aurantimonas sp. E1-2-R+4 TaxID=3113714 RepID=UPI002F953E38
MTRRLDFYYDLLSPYAHIVLARLPDLPTDVAVRPRAILFGAVLAHHGQLGPAEIEAKRLHTYRQAVFLGATLGRETVFPPRHPFNPLAALRLLAGAHDGAGADLATVRGAFDFVFSQGEPVDTPDGVTALAERLGLDPALATAEASKAALRANTEDALAAGVFGVPSFVPYDADGAAGPVFWGVDAFDMLLAFLDEPAIFERPPYAALNHVKIGVRREKANRA